MKADLEIKNDELISKFMAISTKASESEVIVNPSRSRGLPVGFLLLRYSVKFTVESLSLLYLLVKS